MPGILFVISAPSGAGKSTLLDAARSRLDNLGYSISHTSRKPRGREKNGIDYHFVDASEFNRMIDDGAFVEWATVYNDLYGTSYLSLNAQIDSGVDVLLDIDVQGAKNIKKQFKKSILIYVLPPSLETLEKRLRDRGTDDEKVIAARLKSAAEDIRQCRWYDYIVVNDDLENAIREIQSIISAERCRTDVKWPAVQAILGN